MAQQITIRTFTHGTFHTARTTRTGHHPLAVNPSPPVAKPDFTWHLLVMRQFFNSVREPRAPQLLQRSMRQPALVTAGPLALASPSVRVQSSSGDLLILEIAP